MAIEEKNVVTDELLTEAYNKGIIVLAYDLDDIVGFNVKNHEEDGPYSIAAFTYASEEGDKRARKCYEDIDKVKELYTPEEIAGLISEEVTLWMKGYDEAFAKTLKEELSQLELEGDER